MRRNEFSQKERELMKRVENEFQLFKYKMLSKSNIEIYDSCNVIRFYHCIYEYFMYAEDLKDEHLYGCLRHDNVIAALYELYLKYEYLRCDRWEDIEDILNVLIRNQL